MWAFLQDSYRITRTRVNTIHTVICIKTTQNDHRNYSSDFSRSSQRHKRCTVTEDFVPLEEIHEGDTLVDCVWTELRRCTLKVSPHPHVQFFL